MFLNDRGQNLIELLVAMTVGIIVVGALVFATISSLRNTSLAKNKIQATKLAQEAIERVRSARDRDALINFGYLDGMGNPVYNPVRWDDDTLWSSRIISPTGLCGNTPDCYLKLESSNDLIWVSNSSSFPEGFGEGINQIDSSNYQFERAIVISDDPAAYTIEKKIEVIVRWKEFSGPSESRLTTVLGRL